MKMKMNNETEKDIDGDLRTLPLRCKTKANKTAEGRPTR